MIILKRFGFFLAQMRYHTCQYEIQAFYAILGLTWHVMANSTQYFTDLKVRSVVLWPFEVQIAVLR